MNMGSISDETASIYQDWKWGATRASLVCKGKKPNYLHTEFSLCKVDNNRYKHILILKWFDGNFTFK